MTPTPVFRASGGAALFTARIRTRGASRTDNVGIAQSIVIAPPLERGGERRADVPDRQGPVRR